MNIWITDIDFTFGIFKSNLINYWNDSSISTKWTEFHIGSINSNSETYTTTSNQSIIATMTTVMTSTQTKDATSLIAIGNMGLSDLSSLTSIVVLGICFIVGIVAWVDSKFKRHNEFFKISTMFVVTMYLLDVVSDVFFVLQTFESLSSNDNVDYIANLVIFILSVFFLILPMLFNYVQLHKAIQEWVNDIETRRYVQAWVQLHLRALFLICIIFGSAFTAIEICNSNLFYLSVFNMGLNRRQKALFKNQRLFSTVLLEVEFL